MSAVHWAAFHNRPEHLRELLQRGAEILLQDVDGKTALHWAAQVRSEPCLEKTCPRGFRPGPTQPQKIARGLKFLISEGEGLYYLCSENKGADHSARKSPS